MPNIASMQLDDEPQFEYVQDFSGGEDSFRRSTLIDPNQCQKLVNVIVRDNYEARTRHGADSIPTANTSARGTVTTTMTFSAGDQNTIAVASAVGIAVGAVVVGTGITTGTTVAAVDVANDTVSLSAVTTDSSSGDYTFTNTAAIAINSLLYFDTPSKQQLLAGVDKTGAAPGFMRYESGAWADLSGAWKPDAAGIRLAMAQGIDTVLISDGVGKMQIYDGATFAEQGDTAADPPKGATILCWHTQRMFASGVSTAPDTIWVSLFLEFGTGKWNTTNRSFRIGAGDGDPIVAIASMQQFTLAVLKRNSVWLVSTNPANDDPTDPTAGFAAEQVTEGLAQGVGCVGRDAWCSYGNDLLFMSQDGVRSVQRMQAAAAQWQLSAPISQPIQPYIDRINQNYWHRIVAKKYAEFAFFFVPLDNSTTNNCVLVWNGRLGKWIGAWTGWNGNCIEVTRFLAKVAMVFGDTTGKVNQWKEASNLVLEDSTYLDNGTGYTTQLLTRAFQFGDAITGKSAHSTILRFSAGNALMTMRWVADLNEVKTWPGTFEQSGSVLDGDDQLDINFVLSSNAPMKIIKGIRGLPAFNEAYLTIESTAGWWFLRNITAMAFLNPLKEV